MKLHRQKSLELAPCGGGASSVVYMVNKSLVLKAPKIYTFDSKEDSEATRYEGEVTMFCSHQEISNERRIYRLLGEHRNLVRAIALGLPEGIYLERHEPLLLRLKRAPPSRETKNSWYLDMLHGLMHFHQAKVAHADVRPANFLCDSDDSLLLCDFATSKNFGDKLPEALDVSGCWNLNGPFTSASASSDVFALSSTMFEIEFGHRPILEAWSDPPSKFPQVDSGCSAIDRMISQGWRGGYSTALEMLQDLPDIFSETNMPSGPSKDTLYSAVEEWRLGRIQRHGELSIRFFASEYCS